MIKINIGDKADVNAQTIITGRGCVIGQSGSGKSYLVGVITEELCLNNLPFMIIDTEGEYHNLKLKFDAIWVGNDEKADLGFGIDYSDLIHRSIDDLVPIILYPLIKYKIAFSTSDNSSPFRFISGFLII